MQRDVYLSIGTNLGDRVRNLRMAEAELVRELGPALAISGIYETEPWGFKEQPAFLNMCARFGSARNPEELLAIVKGIERKLGRLESFRWGPRLIDIDILRVGRLRRRSEGLTLPHPMMWDRAFVIVPLSEIALRMRSPEGENIRSAAKRLDPEGKIKRLADLHEGGI